MFYTFCGLVLLAATSNAMYPPNSDVINLNPSNFDRLVTQTDAIWIVEFYAPWCRQCQNLVPEYTKAAKALKGVVKMGAVNVDEHKSLGGQFDVSGFPTLKLFGTDKSKPEEFKGQRTVQGFVDAAFAALESKVTAQMGGGSKTGNSGSSKGDSNDVIELTDSNFDKLVIGSDDLWLVEFHAPWCGHCKDLAPKWAQAAAELKGKVKVGALDATVHTVIAGQYQVKGFPTIRAFASGKKDSHSVSDYNGGRTTSEIVNWALAKLTMNIPAPEIHQLTDSAVMAAACFDRPLCIVAILPHLLDCQTDCRNVYLDTLRKTGEQHKRMTWGWLWSEAGAQPDMESTLEIGGFGYPAMAVLNTKKMKYTIFRGSFSYEDVNEFLRGLAFGRGATAPVKGDALPVIKTTDVWDGKDGDVPIEDEMDLSDVDLGDVKEEL